VRDNGDGFSPDMLERLQSFIRQIEGDDSFRAEDVGSHVGLLNTYARVYYYSQGRMRMRLYNDGGAVVEIAAAKHRGEGAADV